MPARVLNEVIGVSRMSDVSAPVDDSLGAATILPGVPLPSWSRAPEPEPEPEPAPLPEPAFAAVLAAPVVLAAPAVQATPAVEPVASLPAPVAQSVVVEPPAAPAIALPMTAAAVAPAFAYAAPTQAPVQTDQPAPEGEPVPADQIADQPEDADVDVDPTGTTEAIGTTDDAPPTHATHSTDTDEHGEPGADESSTQSRRPLVLLGLLGVVVILAVVAAFVWPGLLLTSDTGAAVPGAAKPPAAKAVVLATPDSLAGLDRVSGDVDAALRTAANATTLTGFGAPVSAVYGSKGVPAATVIAWTASSSVPAQSVSAAFAGFGSASSAFVSDIAVVPGGSLGGQMSCGSSTVSATPATVCFWADSGSFGAVTVLRPTSPARGAEIAAAVRAGVETLS